MSSKIYELLKEAIKIFYDQDAEKLLRGGRRRASERCIVNCIARYLWFLLQQRNIEADVDVEYNLDYRSGTAKCVRGEMCCKSVCDGCLMKKYATGKRTRPNCVVKTKCSNKIKNACIFPDLIVHKRGAGNNYLAVEFKMEDTAIKDERKLANDVNRYKSDAFWDFAKLQYFACTKRMDGFECYDKVAFVIVKPDNAEILESNQFPKLAVKIKDSRVEVERV